MSAQAISTPVAFTGYQKFVVAMLAFLQFTIIIDFMIVSPLGAMVMPALDISPKQFGLVVSAYALAAGVSSFIAAGYADRFDRKKFLLFFYTGFMFGTLLCGLANSFEVLLGARIVTGLFGGVIGSVVLAIATDLFPMELRGRVMGTIQTAFAASQVLGLPAGLYISNAWDWHAPFFTIVVIGTGVGIVIATKMQAVEGHLALHQERSAFAHLWATLSERKHFLAFGAVALLATGGYMIMPFGTAFTVNNLKIGIDHLPTIYLVTGIAMIFIGPVAGRASDKFGKFPVFMFGTVLSTVMIIYYTHMGATHLVWVIVVNVLLFMGIFSRIVPSQALMSAVPHPSRRGAFNAVTVSLQQITGGASAALAGIIVTEGPGGELQHFPVIGYVVTAASLFTLYFMYRIHKQVPEKTA